MTVCDFYSPRKGTAVVMSLMTTAIVSCSDSTDRQTPCLWRRRPRPIACEPGSSDFERGAGFEAVPGSLDDRASLRRALRTCVAVFADVASGDEVWEATRGTNLINAVSGAEVDYLVLRTRSAALEAYARSLEVPATFIRPLVGIDLPFEFISDAVVRMFDDPAAYVGRGLAIHDATRIASALTNNSQLSKEWS